ncbi:hypothetical protein SAMN05421690_10782 [Nitrosomonas sp. Nm51]|nr:hypothetical protein SAMN05421690_10782 [Nitrosomonas sp. Nm51]
MILNEAIQLKETTDKTVFKQYRFIKLLFQIHAIGIVCHGCRPVGKDA